MPELLKDENLKVTEQYLLSFVVLFWLDSMVKIFIGATFVLQTVFQQNRHEDALDLACVQFEPDSADYIRVSRL